MTREGSTKTCVFLLVIVLLIVILFSYVNTRIKIKDNNSEVKRINIVLRNIDEKKGSIKPSSKPSIVDNQINYSVLLKNSEDYYEFYVDVYNNENSDIMLLKLYQTPFTDEEKEIYDFSVTYKDNTPVSKDDILKHGEYETFKVCIKYSDSVVNKERNVKDNNLLNLNISFDYIKADQGAKEVKHPKFKPIVGDYVSMIPTTKVFNIDTSKTGYTKEQKVLNPSELNLWRVIKINDDNTVDVVSVYTSSVLVSFEGQTGYLNYIGYLNTIANAYQNSKYSKKSRIVGYNNQTGYIKNSQLFSSSAPWTYSTINNDNEKLGGGDILYTDDINLIKNTFGTLKTLNSNLEQSSYWISSRYYYYRNKNNYYWNYRYIDKNGIEDFDNLFSYQNNKQLARASSNSLRVILTLKNNIEKVLGNGSDSDPYILD